METVLSLIIGIGLSAACGFRVFVPLLGLSLASLTGHVTLSPGFAWIGTWPALIAFATAAVLEIGAYSIPWLDHLLDTLTTPAAVVAGTMMTASLVTELSPLLKWTLALIAGGGMAGMVQAGTVLLRGTSTATTGGAGNLLVALGEAAGSVLTTLLAILVPVAGFLIAGGLLLYIVVKRLRGRKNRHPKDDPPLGSIDNPLHSQS